MDYRQNSLENCFQEESVDYRNLSDYELFYASKNYRVEEDPLGEEGRAIADELFNRCGRNLKNLNKWEKLAQLKPKERSLLDFLEMSNQYGLSPRTLRPENKGDVIGLLNFLDVYNACTGKTVNGDRIICPLKEVSYDRIYSMFEGYYSRAIKLSEKLK